MKSPQHLSAVELKDWSYTVRDNNTGQWIPKRVEPYYGLRLVHRCKLAWKVFTGEYDALDWLKDIKKRVPNAPKMSGELEVHSEKFKARYINYMIKHGLNYYMAEDDYKTFLCNYDEGDLDNPEITAAEMLSYYDND